MQRLRNLVPVTRLLSPKILLAKDHIQTRQTLVSSSRNFLPIFASANYSTGRKNDGKDGESEPKDPWDEAWVEKPSPSSAGEGKEEEEDPWGTDSSWSTGLTEDHFEGGAVGRPVAEGEVVGPPATAAGGRRQRGRAGADIDPNDEEWVRLKREYEENKKFVDSIDQKKTETFILLKQVREPGLRGSYLKDSEKQEMYKLHKENPEVYNVERLAKDFRIMRQRVHAILWLKEDEEEMEKRMGRPLDDAVEQLLDTCPELFKCADREFHVAELPLRPDFKVMPEDWDGTAKDPDEKLWEISQREDEMLYQEFVQRMNFNKAQIAGKVKCHKYSRRRPPEGWKFTIEELGPKGKRGRGGGRRFVGLPDGSRRPLNDLEKMFLKRETNRPRRKIV